MSSNSCSRPPLGALPINGSGGALRPGAAGAFRKVESSAAGAAESCANQGRKRRQGAPLEEDTGRRVKSPRAAASGRGRSRAFRPSILAAGETRGQIAAIAFDEAAMTAADETHDSTCDLSSGSAASSDGGAAAPAAAAAAAHATPGGYMAPPPPIARVSPPPERMFATLTVDSPTAADIDGGAESAVLPCFTSMPSRGLQRTKTLDVASGEVPRQPQPQQRHCAEPLQWPHQGVASAALHAENNALKKRVAFIQGEMQRQMREQSALEAQAHALQRRNAELELAVSRASSGGRAFARIEIQPCMYTVGGGARGNHAVKRVPLQRCASTASELELDRMQLDQHAENVVATGMLRRFREISEARGGGIGRRSSAASGGGGGALDGLDHSGNSLHLGDDSLDTSLDDGSSGASLDNPYWRSDTFARELMGLCQAACGIFELEDRVLTVQSPVHIFGDLHGNISDLAFFAENVWSYGANLTPGGFLFLGDYVDRGDHSIEVVAWLLALKIAAPRKIHLLRGNHEIRDVNGWEDHYGAGCLLAQCKEKFGGGAAGLGLKVYEMINQAFDRMPLAAIVDEQIFCVHGGIPRPPVAGADTLAMMRSLSHNIQVSPPSSHETFMSARLASDLIWADPATDETELLSGMSPGQQNLGRGVRLDADGFGPSLRGGDSCCFGVKAIEAFLKQHELMCIVRAHQAQSTGIGISKGARVFTVFSTSQNHGCGPQATCGCLLVDDGRIMSITRAVIDQRRLTRSTSFSVPAGFGSPAGDEFAL